ncbi:23S rRNA (uracil(1939)-C(5))-methyltransferase RlmD [filamentous cyanobacterium CCP2]|nr:23S rRNA (uracil(1939)-C(5))-methyltransferase RlmD [filamentous cyanobacterium CCP2]
MRRRKPLPIVEQVAVSSIGAKGKPIALVDGTVAYLDQGVPGDIVDLQLKRRKKGYFEARVLRFHQHSPLRVEPFCQHFGDCGGCKWQNLPYGEQLKYKQKAVWAALEELHLVEPFEFRDILPSPATQYYRNKLEYTFSNRRWLSQAEVDSQKPIADRNAAGFHVRGMFDRVLDIETCYLQPEPSNAIRQALRAFAVAHGLEFYDPRAHTGFLRTLMIRTTSTGEVMTVVVFAKADRPTIEQVMQHLAAEFPQITSLLYTINTKLNDTLFDLDILIWRGSDFITEQLGDLKFRIGAKSFFQTNTEQAFHLYQQAAKLAGLTGQETVYDLYTGTGTIANFIARQAKQVIGIEYVAEAIEDAKVNSSLNNIHNTRFFAGDIKTVLTPEFVSQEGKPDVLITDPPRAGMHPDVVEQILHIQPDRIVYVSCNPNTQANDLKLLNEQYKLQIVQPVDMFPQTYHVENVALLERR